MSKSSGLCVSALLIAWIAVPAAGAEADSDPFAACRFLVGDWVGEGSGRPGQGKGVFTFRPELQGKVLVRRHRTEIAAGPDQPAQIHEDLIVVYPAGKGQPLKATYWDNEAHTIQYTVHPSADGKALTFLSDPSPAGPRFRLTYSRKGEDEVGIAFAIAPPGKPDEFKTYTEGSARRKPMSQVGAVGSLPRGYVAYRAAEPITIDGKLDEAAWQAAPWTETFVDIEGDRSPPRGSAPGSRCSGTTSTSTSPPSWRNRTSGPRSPSTTRSSSTTTTSRSSSTRTATTTSTTSSRSTP